MMRSWSVNQPKPFGDTKLLGTKNNFEDIDEAQHSESKGTSNKHFIQDKEQSNTSLERDILDISEIVDNNKLTKKKILENISFDTTQHDIYNPDFSSCDFKLLGNEEEEVISMVKNESKSPTKFLSDYEISLKDLKPHKQVSPFRIRK